MEIKRICFNRGIKKLERFDLSIMKEQVGLIEFSIKTPNALYSTELKSRAKNLII